MLHLNFTIMKATLVSCLIAVLIAAQTSAQTSKSLVQSFNVDGINTVALALNGKVEIEQWDNSFIRIICNIDITNANESTLKNLVAVGRYNITSTINGNATTLSTQKIKSKVTMGGRELDEKITFKVFYPKNVSVQVTGSAL